MGKSSKYRIGILGDSYSTFQGYIPQTHVSYYPKPEKVPDVNCVEDTWWHQLCRRMDWDIHINDSYSGTTVCKDVRDGQPSSSAFVNRMKESLHNSGIDGMKLDFIFIFGATNDSWLNRDIGKVQFGDWSDHDLFSVLPAYCYLLDYVTEQNPTARIICILNDIIKPEIKAGIIEAAQHYKVGWLELSDIDKSSGHPTKLGMQQIAKQVEVFLIKWHYASEQK